MQNLKIKVNSEAESKEVQEYLLANGLEKPYNNFTLHNGWVCIRENQILCVCESQAGSELDEFKELNFPQLHDLVVLTRNDLNDANHTDQDGWKWFLTSNRDGYVFAAGNAQQLPRWDKSPLDHVDLKPIQKPLTELMKDVQVIKKWLDPNDDYNYHKASVFGHGSGWIEIPSGSEIAVLLDEKIFFWKDKGLTHWSNSNWNSCKIDTSTVRYFSFNEFINEWKEARIVWKITPDIAGENLQEKNNFQTIKVNGLEDLIDGRKALSALLAWEKVQINFQPWDEHLWVNIDPTKDNFSIPDFFNDCTQSGQKVFFRLKPSVITINGVECSRPELNKDTDLELLEKDQQYWLVDLTSPELASQYKWHGSSEEYSWAERGLIHLKKQNAISHAKALIQATVGSIE